MSVSCIIEGKERPKRNWILINHKFNKMRNGSNLDFEQENRRSRVLALYSKNLTQFEIAQELKVDQSTISRDLCHIKEEAKRKVVEVTDDLSFEYLKYLASTDEISRELWNIVNTKLHPLNNNNNDLNMNHKNRIAALTLLLGINKQRIEATTGGTKSTHDFVGTTIMSHGHDMKEEMKTPKEREQDRINRLLNL
jgi:hypothetical protein